MNLVVADDEQIVRQGISAACKQAVPTLQVKEARDGREVLQILGEAAIDILFVDIRMPHIGGLQLLEELQARGAKTVTVIVSGYDDFSYAQVALRLGALDYLLKPAGFAQVSDTVRRAVDLAQSRTVHEQAVESARIPVPASADHVFSPLHKASLYIDARVHKKISLADAARAAHVSPTHLATLFKQKLGQTFLEYVTASKMEAACSMLVKGLLVQEVAERLGYEDAKYFGQLFHKHTGIRPREYRVKVLQYEVE